MKIVSDVNFNNNNILNSKFDVDNNILSNIETDNFKENVIVKEIGKIKVTLYGYYNTSDTTTYYIKNDSYGTIQDYFDSQGNRLGTITRWGTTSGMTYIVINDFFYFKDATKDTQIEESAPASDLRLLTEKGTKDVIDENKTNIETFALDDVFDFSANTTIATPNSTYKLVSPVTVITNNNTGIGMMFANFYCATSVSQSATGWKNHCFVYKSSFPYVHRDANNTGGSEAVRCLGSMWANNGYVNTVIGVRSAFSDGTYGSTSGAFQIYYTSAMLNTTGGINVTLQAPVIAKSKL